MDNPTLSSLTTIWGRTGISARIVPGAATAEQDLERGGSIDVTDDPTLIRAMALGRMHGCVRWIRITNR